MTTPTLHANKSNNRLFLLCGFIGIASVFAVSIANLIGMLVVEKHDPIADTISALAIGNYSWIQDTGLNILAIGFIACAVALFIELKQRQSSNKLLFLASALLLIAGIDIVVIAEHNKYAGRPGVGASIHIYCVILLGFLLALIFYLMQPYFKNKSAKFYKINRLALCSWIILAPLFFVISDNYDGLYERIISLIPLGWLVMLSLNFINLSK